MKDNRVLSLAELIKAFEKGIELYAKPFSHRVHPEETGLVPICIVALALLDEKEGRKFARHYSRVSQKGIVPSGIDVIYDLAEQTVRESLRHHLDMYLANVAGSLDHVLAMLKTKQAEEKA